MSEAIGMSEARAHFSDMVTKTSTMGTTFVIHCRGEPKAVLISVEEYKEMEGIRATLEELEDTGAYEEFNKGMVDIKKGKMKTAEEIFGEALL